MKNVINKITAGISVLPVLLLPSLANATGTSGLTAGAGLIGSGQAGTTVPLPTLVSNLINVVLGVMGILFVILIVYAGLLYMQAGTDPDKAKKAKSLIINAVIGLILIVAAYAIANFVINQIIGATT